MTSSPPPPGDGPTGSGRGDAPAGGGNEVEGDEDDDMPFGRRVRRTAKGAYKVKLPTGERNLLAGLMTEMRDRLLADHDDDTLRRLFPPAYADDAEHQAEYKALVHDELLEKRLAAIDVVEQSVSADELDAEQLAAWMGAVNDLRLMLGTYLDVAEDMDPVDEDDPNAPAYAVYDYLTMLLSQIVDAMAGW
jgi:hypothetical protein